jgi:DNA polymerase bacteriophage-type
MSIIFWDVETRSTLALETAGAWCYAASPATEVLCVGFAVDDADPEIWTPGEPIPQAFVAAANDPSWSIVAHNYMFERAIATRILEPQYGWPRISTAQQRCSMTLALVNALPGGLDAAAAALSLPVQKDADGYKLMRKMSQPLPKRKRDAPGEIRWHDTPEARTQLAQYCKQDVIVERMLFNMLPPIPPVEQERWELDAVINERGFCTDVALAVAARDLARSERQHINAEIANLTDGEITSIDQVERIRTYVERQGHQLSSLNKRSVSAVLAHEPGEAVRCVLELRREGARASVRKLDRLLATVDADNRLRGSLRFHAAHTGRWSGRGYQPQNLKRPETKDIDAAVDAVLSGDIARVRELGAPLTIAGDIQRSVICAAPGHNLIAGDFSAIESRVLAWLAGEKWKLANYVEYDATGRPELEPYCATASKMLQRVVTPEDEAGRQIGKTADLALGFGGALGAWRRFNPDDDRPDGEILLNIAEWRRAHPAIVRFWKALERAAMRAVHTGQQINLGDHFSFTMEGGTLFITLPSGRRLAYPQARLGAGKFEGRRQIYFKSNARGGWTDDRGWYGTFTENVVQATARDLLAAAMQRLEAADYKVVLHVHDEIVCEVPEDFGSEDEFRRLLLELPDWAVGLPIAGKVRSGKRYAKSSAKRGPESTTQAEPSQLQVGVLGVTERELPSGSDLEHNPVDGDDDAHVERDDDGHDDDDDEIGVSLAYLVNEELIDGKMCCPFHDDSTPSLKIYDDHYHCFGCGAHGDRIDWLMAIKGHSRAEAVNLLKNWDGPVTPRQPSVSDDVVKRASALRLWEEARPIAGTLAARYLADIRHINLDALPAGIDDVLRFHPCCPFGSSMRHPCLLALMRNTVTDTPTGIHRIALTPDARKIERRMLGHAGVVKLWPAGAQLVVGEGIETVLAAATRIPYRDAPLRPAWAMLSAAPLEYLPVLPGVERLIILVDHDPAGTRAARICTDRWQRAGRTVVRLTPKRAGADFNDLVMPESVS